MVEVVTLVGVLRVVVGGLVRLGGVRGGGVLSQTVPAREHLSTLRAFQLPLSLGLGIMLKHKRQSPLWKENPGKLNVTLLT